MEKSIVSKGKNVKMAVDSALELLDGDMTDVEIEVIENETKGILGMGAKPAVVRVTKKMTEKKTENSIEMLENKIKDIEIPDPMDSFADEASGYSSSKTQTERLNFQGKVWVRDGQIFCANVPDQYPIISPGKDMILYQNGERVEGSTIVDENDILKVELKDETRDPEWEIEIDDEKLKTVITVSPGVRIYRRLKERAPDVFIELEVEERKEVIPIESKLILERLRELGVVYGVDYTEIAKACTTEESGEFIIATGERPKPGKNGYFMPAQEVDIKKSIKQRPDGSMDFKEIQEFPSVERGQLIGSVHPPIPGIPGTTVTGEAALPPETYVLHTRVGKGVATVGDDSKMIAIEAGQPEIKIKGQSAQISIAPNLTISKDVDLETGNVHFIGNVDIAGSVQDGMLVEAQGNIQVRNNVNNANIMAGSSIIVHRNIITSEVVAGKSNLMEAEMSLRLGEVVQKMKQMEAAIHQLSNASAFKVDSTKAGLGPLIKILCDGKLKGLMPLISSLHEKIKSGQQWLDKDWTDLGESFEKGFIMFHSSNIRSIADLNALIEKSMDLFYYTQELQVDKNCFIQARFAHNSRIYSSGDITITGKGCYNSKLHAAGFIYINGEVRGGEIYADQGVKIKEAGTRSGVITKITVPRDKTIEIGKALEGTLIKIGSVAHDFLRETTNVCARLDENGTLSLH